MEEIKIKLSKKKMLLMLAGAVCFIILGGLFVSEPQKFISTFFRNTATIRFTGILSIIFFGSVGIYGLIKLFDKSDGLVINQNGIIDNTNASSVGLIDWTDILRIETQQVMSTKFLLIFVSNPDKYLNRITGLKRKLLQANMKTYGTPISITSNSLMCSFDDLEKLVTLHLNEYRKTKV